MSLFNRTISEGGRPLKTQAQDTGVPLKILKQVHDRGVQDAPAELPDETKDACGQARVADFVRGGAARVKDGDLWRQYQQEDIGPNGEVKAGVFIPLPDILARYFPKKEEDDSVPHLTVLYVGAITPEETTKLVEAVQGVAKTWPPFRMDIASYDEFQNKEGQTIAHMVPTAAIELAGPDSTTIYRSLGDLHADLFAAVESVGIDVQHNYAGQKDADYHERVALFKSHATLAYLPPGEKYTGHKPTGSWIVTEIEVWSHQNYRIPLGGMPQMTQIKPLGLAAQVAAEEIADEPEEVVETVVVEPVTVTPLAPEVAEQVAEKVAVLRTQADAAVVAGKLDEAIELMEESAKTLANAGFVPRPDAPPDAPTATLETPGHRIELSDQPKPEPIGGMRYFESRGYLSESVLDFGGRKPDHAYAHSDDEDVFSRHWKTIVCTTLGEQSESERLATLLAARGLLARGGKVLVSIQPTAGSMYEWERSFRLLFEVKQLASKPLWAWQLTPYKEFVEQELPAPVPAPPPQLPPINVGPIILKIPERQVQVVAPITAEISMPAQEPPQVHIDPGAVKVQVDVHPPPAVKKRIVMSKDPYGKVVGELEIAEDKPAASPEFPDIEEILATPPE